MAKYAGLEVLRHYAKSTRVCIDVRAANGTETTFTLANKPGDLRGDLNAQSEIRRFARTHTPSTPAPIEYPPILVQQPTPDAPRERITMKAVLDTALKRIADEPKAEPTTVDVTKAAQELTPKEFYKLCEWAKKQDLASFPTAEAMALSASSFIGQTVSEQALSEAFEAISITAPEHWTPRGDPMTVLARELATFMQALGTNPSPQFSRLLGELV